MTSHAIGRAIGQVGRTLGPDVLKACQALFDAEQLALMQALPPICADVAYGPDDRHRLDLYRDDRTNPSPGLRPILLFVHGGGFRMGDKGGADSWPNAAVGRMAAQRGWLGAVMNYRLAPDHQWPAGGEDVLAAFDWLKAHAASHGGDPERIFVMGTSAGSVHVATALQLRPDLAASGLILLSGLYGYTDPDPRDLEYMGDAAFYQQRMPREAVSATELPLLIATAEHDPERFQREFAGLIAERLARYGALPQMHYGTGHNHYSLAMHLGTSDTILADAIARFIVRRFAEDGHQ